MQAHAIYKVFNTAAGSDMREAVSVIGASELLGVSEAEDTRMSYLLTTYNWPLL